MKPIDKLLDCQHVKRWTLVATDACSTVASHSFNVAMIAVAIRHAMFNTLYFSDAEVAFYALFHDVDEAETGDMPTPTKEAIRRAGVEPNSLFETQGAMPAMPAHIVPIIKIADLIDNYLFISEHGTGARARLAIDEVHGRLRDAIDAAPSDLSAAADRVLKYIIYRESETNGEERIRIAREGKVLRETTDWVRSLVAPELGGES